MEGRKKVNSLPTVKDLDHDFDRVTDELMDSHAEAVRVISDKGDEVDTAMATITTATQAMITVSAARGMAEIVEAIQRLNESVDLIADRIGVKLPPGTTVH